MIRLVESEQALLQYPCRDAYAVRAFALLKSYGTGFSFARFWLQETGGETTAFLAALDGHLTLSFLPDADLEELGAFVQTIGFATLQCDGAFRLRCAFQTGPVLVCGGRPIPPLPAGITLEKNLSLDVIYRLNRTALNGSDYTAWYADVSRRIRQKTAVSYGLLWEGEPVSAAMLTAKHQNYAVIGYVATSQASRGQGFGSTLLRQITEEKAVSYFVLCEEKLRPFYERTGFQCIGNWRIYQNDIFF